MELPIILFFFLTGLTNDNKWKLITCCKKEKKEGLGQEKIWKYTLSNHKIKIICRSFNPEEFRLDIHVSESESLKKRQLLLGCEFRTGTADPPINFPIQQSYRINISTEGFT